MRDSYLDNQRYQTRAYGALPLFVQVKINLGSYRHGDRLPLDGSRLELPLPHRFGGFLVKSASETFANG
jgi:hypothetical protein